MKRNKQTESHSHRAIWLLLAIAGYVTVLGVMLRGKNLAIINPKGFIAEQQHSLLIYVVMIMLILAIPTVSLIYFTAWKYRDTNKKAQHDTGLRYGKFLSVGLWLVPAVFIAMIASMMVPATHRLEPKKALADDRPPLTIQVVALRWKWLFIYPEQKIATVNYVIMPVHTPVQFELTADETPMSSFWIPNIGGQLYAMTGHVNRLNLQADMEGDFPGKAAEINGAGFSDMNFVAHADDQQSFDKLVETIKNSQNELDAKTYQAKLLPPSENNGRAVFRLTDQNLYDEIVHKYSSGHTHE